MQDSDKVWRRQWPIQTTRGCGRIIPDVTAAPLYTAPTDDYMESSVFNDTITHKADAVFNDTDVYKGYGVFNDTRTWPELKLINSTDQHINKFNSSLGQNLTKIHDTFKHPEYTYVIYSFDNILLLTFLIFFLLFFLYKMYRPCKINTTIQMTEIEKVERNTVESSRDKNEIYGWQSCK